MANLNPSERSFPVRCGYCGGQHVASLDTPPYGGQDSQGYGLFYGVICETPKEGPRPVRYGVLAATDSRIHI